MESATSWQLATSQCLSALPDQLGSGKFALDSLRWTKINQRTYYSCCARHLGCGLIMIPPEGGLESRPDSRKRLCFIHVTVKIVLGLPYKTIIKSWNTHASSSSQEALLC